ncbi:nitroreductase family deazaflavin-dependent oxidoreductase [Kitasatospora sp. NPDC101155]|uniref:nitroreductase family deazaflavin-dependent oxidoreductase n=1 Tax=Kitasatospora sp. NPDC101155 TaxID=3364097 RepID=UPI0038069130
MQDTEKKLTGPNDRKKPPSKAQRLVNRAIVRANVAVYRASGGKIAGRFGELPVLLLTTRGRKTGIARTSALGYIPDGDRYVICGAYGGEPVHPAWALNLRAIPGAVVEVGRQRFKVTARELPAGAERDRLWQRMVDIFPLYGKFETKTGRLFPIVVLTPVD